MSETSQKRGRIAGDHRRRTGRTAGNATGAPGPNEEGEEPGRVLGHVRGRRRGRRQQHLGVGQRQREEEELRRQVHKQNEVVHDDREEDFDGPEITTII